MKIKFLVVALIFSSVSLFAQENKNSFIVNGDLIEATLYHDNGVISQTGFYNKEGNLHGEWISYNANGIKTAVAKYNNGDKVDTWFFFEKDKISEVTYANSKVSKIKTWESTKVDIVSN